MRKAIDVQERLIPEFKMPNNFRLSGWVYALTNPAMPGLFKIGMTTSSPEARAREISQGTGVPLPFEVARAFYSEDPREDERALHDYLSPVRVNESREFFETDIETVDLAAADCGLHSRDAPVSELADSFDIICLNSVNSLNLNDLFDDIGISVFGCNLAAAEALIRMAANVVISQASKGNSVIFNGNKALRIKSDLTKRHEDYMAGQQLPSGES